MSVRNVSKFFVLLMAVLLFAIGCSPVVPAQVQQQNPASAPSLPQVLTVAAAQDVGPLNPHNYSSSFNALDMVYEPLVRYSAGGKIVPALAESWKISDDGLTITFNLRKGVTFHDGTPFDAKAAKWSMERWVGMKDHDWLPTTTKIESIETPDANTLVLKMKEPYYATLQELSLTRPIRFLSPTAVNAKGEFAKPIGTGPWQLSEYVKDQKAVFVPYANYWGAKPKLEKIVFDIIPDPQTRVAALLSGEVQLIGGEQLGSIPLESIAALQSNPDIELLTNPGTTAFMVQTNFRRAPFDDPRVREAFNHAINREGIAKQIFRGYAEPAQGLFPASIPYVTYPHPDAYAFDLAKAKMLLAQAGYTAGADGMLSKDGKPLKVTMIFDGEVFPQAKSMGEAIQAQLKEVGVAAEINVMEYSAWFDALEAGKYDLTIQATWGAPYDPHASITTWFATGAGTSHGQVFNSPELDAMIQELFASNDEAKRADIYAKLWEYIDSNAAASPIVFTKRLYAVRKGIEGFQFTGSDYELGLNNLAITAH